MHHSTGGAEGAVGCIVVGGVVQRRHHIRGQVSVEAVRGGTSRHPRVAGGRVGGAGGGGGLRVGAEQNRGGVPTVGGEGVCPRHAVVPLDLVKGVAHAAVD